MFKKKGLLSAAVAAAFITVAAGQASAIRKR